MNHFNKTSPANDRVAGVNCPHCRSIIVAGAPVTVCSACGTAHHETCWDAIKHCGSYDCSPGRRAVDQSSEPVIKISLAEVEQTPPLPVGWTPRANSMLAPPPSKPRTSRMAIASFVCALVGIPIFGLLTGLVAIILGSLAAGDIRTRNQKGLAFALTGIMLGLVDMVGWTCLLIFFFSGGGTHLHSADFHPDTTALNNLDPKIKTAMQANVLIERRNGSGLGSGVILKLTKSEALVLTNRHVIDPSFATDSRKPPSDTLVGTEVNVTLIDQSVNLGHVVWIAPDGIDLALVRLAGSCPSARATRWQQGRPLVVGDAVFAIGNPYGLGWTHTQGTVSQFRLQDLGSREIRIIQTQTVINQGNSGGGLYDHDGFLVGINTWTHDKRVSEGLNFAIALDVLWKLSPPGLDLSSSSKGPAES